MLAKCDKKSIAHLKLNSYEIVTKPIHTCVSNKYKVLLSRGLSFVC